jgi:hypothetical protein
MQSLQQNAISYVTIYGQGCESCFRFYALSLERQLDLYGHFTIAIEEFDENASTLDEVFITHEIPASMQGNVTVNFDDRVFFIDYVPAEIIIDFLQHLQFDYPRLIVTQTSEDNYRVLDHSGVIVNCRIQNSLNECLN